MIPESVNLSMKMNSCPKSMKSYKLHSKLHKIVSFYPITPTPKMSLKQHLIMMFGIKKHWNYLVIPVEIYKQSFCLHKVSKTQESGDFQQSLSYCRSAQVHEELHRTGSFSWPSWEIGCTRSEVVLSHT